MNRWVLILLTVVTLNGTSQTASWTTEYRRTGALRVVFYNCENLFDIHDDSLTNDNEFTPESDRHWTYKKYVKKRTQLFKAIAATGVESPPEIIGVCEVENFNVLYDLFYRTPLKKYGYKIVHADSPDERGIDVALMYKPEVFSVLSTRFIRVINPEQTDQRTRDILYTKGVVTNSDTLHIMVMHWPSKRGGSLLSIRFRNRVASQIHTICDSIFATNSHARLLLMGDLNDEAFSESIRKHLQTHPLDSAKHPNKLYDLAEAIAYTDPGSYKFQGKWGTIDHFIVSGSLLNKQSGLQISDKGQRIFSAPFLLEPDPTYLGFRVFRTYLGVRYRGGTSDHLPIILDLTK